MKLEPSATGTTVTYAIRTMPSLPFGGRAVVAVVKLSIKQLLGGIATEAERRAGNR